MNTEFINLWLTSAVIIEDHLLSVVINLARIRPQENRRLNTFKARYFIQRGCLEVCDLDGNIVGRCLKPFKQSQDPGESNAFYTTVKVEDDNFWNSFLLNRRALRVGAWTHCVINQHPKTGEDQVCIEQPGITYLTLWMQERARRAA